MCYVLRPGYQLPDSPRPASTQIAQLNTSTAAQPIAAKSNNNDAGSQVVVAAVPQTAPFTTTASAATPVANAAPAKTVAPPTVITKDGSTKQTSLALPTQSSGLDFVQQPRCQGRFNSETGTPRRPQFLQRQSRLRRTLQRRSRWPRHGRLQLGQPFVKPSKAGLKKRAGN